MSQVEERDLLFCEVDALYEGQVVRRDGRALHPEKIIQRTWGWPGKPSKVAWKTLFYEMSEDKIWIRGAGRASQQRRLIDYSPEIVGILLHSLASKTTREPRSHREISWLTLEFSRPIADEGLETGLMAAVAARLGEPLDWVRKHTNFGPWDGLGREIDIDVDAILGDS